jgi:hypothetical protein
VSGEKHAWEVANTLDTLRHFKLVNGRHLKAVALRDKFERKVGGMTQYRRPRALLAKLRRLKKKRKKT